MSSSKRFSRSEKKICTAFIISVAALVFSALLSICIGSKSMSLKEMWTALISGPGGGFDSKIFYFVRLTRTAACIFSGAGLAVSGAVLQGVLANKLASPGIIGVNAGAGFGVALCCAAGAISGWAISIFSFLGAFFAASIVALAAHRIRASRSTVILGGVAVNSILNAASEGIAVLNPDAAALTVEFRVGGYSSVSYLRLIPAGILIIIALIIVFTLSSDLDVLTLGDETAQGLGMQVKLTKTVFLILAALLTGASVSFCGLLGFTGLIIPNAVRHFTGNSAKYLIPLSAVTGASFVTLCDLAGRVIFAPYEIPTGIIMSVIGGPVFIILLIRSRGSHSND